MKRIAIVGLFAAALVSSPVLADENLGEVDLSAGFSLSSYTLTVQAFDDPAVARPPVVVENDFLV